MNKKIIFSIVGESGNGMSYGSISLAESINSLFEKKISGEKKRCNKNEW